VPAPALAGGVVDDVRGVALEVPAVGVVGIRVLVSVGGVPVTLREIVVELPCVLPQPAANEVFGHVGEQNDRKRLGEHDDRRSCEQCPLLERLAVIKLLARCRNHSGIQRRTSAKPSHDVLLPLEGLEFPNPIQRQVG